MIRGSKLALQHMSKEKGAAGGVIVNVASLAGTCCRNDCLSVASELSVGARQAWSGGNE